MLVLTKMLLACCVVLSLMAALASADDTNYFINPPASGARSDFSNDPVWRNGSTQTLQWNTNTTTVNIWIWQNDNDNVTIINPSTGPGFQQYVWTVGQLQSYNASLPNVFFMQMKDGMDLAPILFSSHYFNITGDATTPAASSTSSASPGTTPTPTSAPATAPTQATPTQTGSSGLTPGAKAGIGIGVGLGALAIILAGGALCWFRQRSAAAARQQTALAAHAEEYAATDRKEAPLAELAQGAKPPHYYAPAVASEMPSNEVHQTHELA